jgi:hypothetical protein
MMKNICGNFNYKCFGRLFQMFRAKRPANRLTSVALSELQRYFYDLPDVSGETPFTTGYFLGASPMLFKEDF